MQGARILTVLAIAVGAAMAAAQGQPVRQIAAPPPPMGWSSWNSFSNTVNSQIVMAQAKAMAANGMQRAGYRYINIDEGWWLGKRDADGNIVVDENAWPPIALNDKPGDMSNIVRFVHTLGLKAGIYTDAGKDGCSMTPDLGPAYRGVGSEGHYQQDFLQFARWGFDYVKVDWCGGNLEKLDPAVQYAEIARAIDEAEKSTGHPMYFSICNWGNQSPWTWAAHVGGVSQDIWRTSGDIVDPIVAGEKHADRKASFEKMLANFDAGVHPEAQQTGAYNDPDMMVLGMPGFTEKQNRVHMSLWAISGAPLLVGADLTKLAPETLAVLTNPEVLAIDQDALGLQAVKVAEPQTGVQVWSKPLATPGARAVLLLNRTPADQDMEVHSLDLGLADPSPLRVRDLWSRTDLGNFARVVAIHVAAGDAVLLTVSGDELPGTQYRPEGAAAGRPPCRGCDYRFTKVGARSPWARLRIVYTNPEKATRFAELRVNDQDPVRIAFRSTGPAPGSIVVQARLDRAGAANILTFTPGPEPMPTITAIDVP